MQPRSSFVIGIVAVVAFAAWELVDHLLLMNMGMFNHHALSLVVETTLALLAIQWTWRAARDQAAGRRRAERYAAVIASAMASEVNESSPLRGLREALGEIRNHAPAAPEVEKALKRAEHQVTRLRLVNQELADAFPDATRI